MQMFRWTILTIIVLITSISLVSGTMNHDVEWQKCLGGSGPDYAASNIFETTDGGFFIAGKSSSNDGNVTGNHGMDDFWVVKLDSNGEIEWQKSLGGTKNEEAHSAIQTDDGGYLVGGFTESIDGDVSVNHGNCDVWVVKLNQAGEIEWEKSLGGTDWDISHGLTQTSDGGYVIGAETASTDGDVGKNNGSLDLWIVKLSKDGNFEWQKCYGGSEVDGSFSINNIQTHDGGYLIVGETLSNDGDVSGNHGDADLWVVKTNAIGSIEWQKCYGGSSYDGAWSAGILETDTGYVIAGETTSNDGDVSGNHGEKDIWILNLTPSGTISWQKCLGGPGEELTSSIIQTPDGGYLVSGGTNSKSDDVSENQGKYDLWLIKIDSSGEIEWEKSYGGSNDDGGYAGSSAPIREGGYILAGETKSTDGDVSGNHGETDFWVLKIQE